MSTREAGGELAPLIAEAPNPTHVPSHPSGAASTPGVGPGAARAVGAPSMPELDPVSLTRVISQLANELFQAPVPPSPEPASPTLAPPTAGAAPSPLPAPAPTPASAPTPTPASASPFDAPLDFSALEASPGSFDAPALPDGLSLSLLDADPRAPSPELPVATGLEPAAPAPSLVLPAEALTAPAARDVPASTVAGGAFDPHVLKREFPILSENVRGKRLVWLDNAATTQKPRAVIDRLTHFYEHENSNVHRAAHTLAARATDAYESARESVRRFLKASSTREIVFVRGTTEGINLVAQSWGRRNVREGDEIVLTHLEHHANIVPWQLLAAEKGARIRVAPVDDRGQILLDEYEKLLGPRTRLVALPQVSNALGTITPAKEMIALAHRHGALALLDGAQSVSHLPVDVQDLDCDFFVLSGHKVFAPTGIGVVYGRSDVLDAMPPWQGGGNMIQDVTFEKTTYQPAPARFEAGTGNIADAVGLGAALDWLTKVGVERVERYEHELLEYATGRLATVPGLRMIGTAARKAGVLSFVLAGQKTEEVGGMLDQDGIAVRSGHHCAQPILRRFGLEATVRASLAPYNTAEDIDALVASLHRIQAGHVPLR